MNTESPAIHSTSEETVSKRVEMMAQLRWTAIILFFFLIQAVIWTVALTLTAGDKSHAIIEGYDQANASWAQQMEHQRASDRLGWQARVEVVPGTGLGGDASLRLVMVDADQAPLAGATVQLRAFHTGHAAEVQTIGMSEVEPGVYEGAFRPRYRGQWQLDGTVTVGSAQWILNRREWLDLGAGK